MTGDSVRTRKPFSRRPTDRLLIGGGGTPAGPSKGRGYPGWSIQRGGGGTPAGPSREGGTPAGPSREGWGPSASWEGHMGPPNA